MNPLAIDLYCGLGGWTEGFLAEGYDVIGFDTVAHDYGTGGYPGKLVIRDVRTIHGSEFASATVIVCSPPCQRYSYMAMPWKRAKAQAEEIRADKSGEKLRELNELFEACFRIQREASEAAGRHIPLIVENVRGAERWVGRARWHFGSYYLWGDVPALMPKTFRAQKFNPHVASHEPGSWFKVADSKDRGKRSEIKNGGGSWFAIGSPGQTEVGRNPVKDGSKTLGHPHRRDGHAHTRHLTNPAEHEGVKFSQSGDAWFDGKPRDKMLGDKGPAAYGSRTVSRKAASALIAKIPLPLSQHIARVFHPGKDLAA